MMGEMAGDVQFRKLEATDLQLSAVVAESLDSQSVSREVLRSMLRKRRSLADVEDVRSKDIRSEYMRSLVNAKQVVINRAYLYNNPGIFSDFVDPGEDRETFKEFLSSDVLVPCFLFESLPTDEPRYTTHPVGFKAWQRLCTEVNMGCVRLSWDDAQNDAEVGRRLKERFAGFMRAADSLDPAVLARDLDLASGKADAFRARLTVLARTTEDWLSGGQPVTREALYREFVVADGTDPVEGKYDAGKPFAGELKQLIDLRYHVNLPDAFLRYPLTPIGSLHRTSLQEWRKPPESKEIDADFIIDMLRKAAFSFSQEGLYVESLGALTLSDVKRLRETEQWFTYVDSMERLLLDPEAFPDPVNGAPAVYRAYEAVAREATNIATGKKVQARVRRWLPIAEVVVEVAGAILSVVLSDPPTYKVVGAVSPIVGRRAAPPVVRFIIRGVTEARSRARLSSSLDVMRAQFSNAEKEWNELVSAMSRLPGYERIDDRTGSAASANRDFVEEGLSWSG
jgi:hypothetical protein